jgi:hypothetical protein
VRGGRCGRVRAAAPRKGQLGRRARAPRPPHEGVERAEIGRERRVKRPRECDGGARRRREVPLAQAQAAAADAGRRPSRDVDGGRARQRGDDGVDGGAREKTGAVDGGAREGTGRPRASDAARSAGGEGGRWRGRRRGRRQERRRPEGALGGREKRVADDACERAEGVRARVQPAAEAAEREARRVVLRGEWHGAARDDVRDGHVGARKTGGECDAAVRRAAARLRPAAAARISEKSRAAVDVDAARAEPLGVKRRHVRDVGAQRARLGQHGAGERRGSGTEDGGGRQWVGALERAAQEAKEAPESLGVARVEVAVHDGRVESALVVAPRARVVRRVVAPRVRARLNHRRCDPLEPADERRRVRDGAQRRADARPVVPRAPTLCIAAHEARARRGLRGATQRAGQQW